MPKPGHASASPGAADDAALLAGLRAGEDLAFEQLVEDYTGRLLALARRMVGDADAADVVQEAFVSVVRSVESFEGRSKFSTWLHQITVNAALMRLRKRRRDPVVRIEDLLPRYMDDGHRKIERAAWTAPTDELLERAETVEMLRGALERLSDDYRTVFVLRDLQGLGTLETAEVLGIREGAVKTRLHRARQALRTLIERELEGSAP